MLVLSMPNSLQHCTVSASFVVEQAGVPQMSFSNEKELWNGMSYTERIHLYTKQLIEMLERPSQGQNSIA